MLTDQQISERTHRTEAQVVFERQDGGDLHTGPFSMDRVGVRFGSRVIWLGTTFSSAGNGDQFQMDVALAQEIVRRWQRAA